MKRAQEGVKRGKMAEKIDFEKISHEVWKSLKRALEKIDAKKTEKLIESILREEKVFVCGRGRSELVGKAFAMRLMQLGMESYVVGETTAPAICRDDLLIAISGSGDTEIVYDIVKEAKKQKALVVAITANTKSRIAKESKFAIEIKAKQNKKSEPLASLFEEAALIYLDSVIVELMERLHKKSSDMWKKHANL